jgi:hypothetical protein
MKSSRETILGASLLAGLTVLMIAVALNQNAGRMPPLGSMSSDPDGALALKMWTESLGYTVDEGAPEEFQVPAGASLVFILEPGRLSINDLKSLDQWVQAGGMLIAAGGYDGMYDLARHYEFSFRLLPRGLERALPQVPLLASPPQEIPAVLNAEVGFRTTRQDFVTLVAGEGQPLVVMFDSGAGRVILCSSAYPFSNQGLKLNGNPQLVLNLMAAATANAAGTAPAAGRGTVWFDEWHHGLRGKPEILGPGRWLRYTAAGRALLFAVLVVFLALIFQGRLFGRPVPIVREARRRGPIEYLTAIANLNRRAGHRRAVLDQYRQQIRRQLGRRYRLDPDLPDEEFVGRLARYNPNLEAASLLSLLRRLGGHHPGEAEMVKLAEEASRWLEG